MAGSELEFLPGPRGRIVQDVVFHVKPCIMMGGRVITCTFCVVATPNVIMKGKENLIQLEGGGGGGRLSTLIEGSRAPFKCQTPEFGIRICDNNKNSDYRYCLSWETFLHGCDSDLVQ